VLSTQAVAEAARAVGAEHLVLVSVLGADSESSNQFLRSKGEAERLARGSGVGVTILRTPILLGPGTAGSAALRRSVVSGWTKLLGGGRHILRPLDVDDLSRAVLAACAELSFVGTPDGVITATRPDGGYWAQRVRDGSGDGWLRIGDARYAMHATEVLGDARIPLLEQYSARSRMPMDVAVGGPDPLRDWEVFVWTPR
jgi:nucleoside-diphosphate-sugar epimerase